MRKNLQKQNLSTTVSCRNNLPSQNYRVQNINKLVNFEVKIQKGKTIVFTIRSKAKGI